MKYFTFTARCAKHDVDLEYIEPEGFEPDLVPIPMEPELGERVQEYELEFASRWQCPTFQKKYEDNDEIWDHYDSEREHWEFVAQNSEEAS